MGVRAFVGGDTFPLQIWGPIRPYDVGFVNLRGPKIGLLLQHKLVDAFPNFPDRVTVAPQKIFSNNKPALVALPCPLSQGSGFYYKLRTKLVRSPLRKNPSPCFPKNPFQKHFLARPMIQGVLRLREITWSPGFLYKITPPLG